MFIDDETLKPAYMLVLSMCCLWRFTQTEVNLDVLTRGGPEHIPTKYMDSTQ
jgi:hypothetical protein